MSRFHKLTPPKTFARVRQTSILTVLTEIFQTQAYCGAQLGQTWPAFRVESTLNHSDLPQIGANSSVLENDEEKRAVKCSAVVV